MPPQTKSPTNTEGLYVVTTDALVLKTGKATNQATRATRGQVVRPDPEFVNIAQLVAWKALSPHDGEQKVRTNAQALAKAAGAADDPVAVPDAGFLTAPAQAAPVEEDTESKSKGE